MMRTCRCVLLILITLSCCQNLWAKHLVGGELTYQCLGSPVPGFTRFEISLTLYRDCRPTENRPNNTPFDRQIRLHFFDGATGSFHNELPIALGDSTFLTLTSNDTCVAIPDGLCYLVTTYRDTIDLPNNPNGYHVAWGRCCRNETIVNIANPGNYGVVFSAFIPNTAFCNSSPVFKNNLPTFICQNSLFDFDHSAVDADGDSLVYRITTPYSAGDEVNYLPTPSPPPYQEVSFLPPFDINNIMGGTQPLSIDPQTGRLQVIPDQLGQYVFSVSVLEYRNGMLLSEVKRDIQVNVIDCPINNPPRIQLPVDTILFYRGEENCLSFDIIDRNGSGIPADVLTIRAESQILSGGNIPPFATFQAASGTSPLQAELCWLPPCVDIGLDPIPFMVQATDQNDCPAPNITRDTFYIRLLPASALPPVLNCVTVTGPTQVALSWAPLPPEQRPGFQSYFIERNDGSGWQTISIIPQADLDSYTDFTAVNAYQQPYCYRIRSTRRCPVLISSEPGNELCTLVTRAESLSEVQTRISWNAYGQGAFAYSLFVESGGSERLLAENIQDTTYLLEACSFQGRIRVAVTDPATGCTSYGSYTREVIHANDPPEAVELCRVNVEKGRIRLEWEPTAIPDFASYRIYRKGGRNTQYELIEQIDSAAQSNFTDGVDPATSAYCYLIEVVDQCGQAVASAEDCQVLLQAVQRDFQVEINWTPYLGWEQVLGYELWEVADTTFPRLLHTFGNMDRSFTDKEVLQSRGKYCYQLRAIESLNGCGVESWSNVSCVVFSPSIFIPNAFTPNGDGINDVFSIKGLFVNQYHLSIFNRWGERIFESRNVDEGWDGTNQQGLAVPEGVYIYRLLMQGFEGETLERGGSITLIR